MDTVVTGDGCRLWTTRSGAGDPLVLCHGGPGFWDTLGDVAGLLGDVATVHRWDQRGCGRSDRRGPFTVDRALADLDAVLDHHGLARAALLGHSWGAELALRYSLARPGRVTRLAYVSGIGIDPEATWHDDYERNFRDRLGGHLDRWRELEGRRRTEAEEREFDRLWLSADYVDRARALEHAERELTPYLGTNWACGRALNADRRRSLGGLLDACRALRVPVLLVDGAHDIRPRRAVDSLERALPAARRVVLTRAGHLPWVEEPAAFRAAVARFLTASAGVS